MKITIDKAVLEQALNALIEAAPHTSDAAKTQADAIVALREALAQPQQEPVPPDLFAKQIASRLSRRDDGGPTAGPPEASNAGVPGAMRSGASALTQMLNMEA